jgi:hypothetical protein
MKILLAFAAVLLLAGCPAKPTPPDTGLAGFDPHLIENQRAICEDRGGRFGKGGLSGGFVCYQETRDANQSCSTKSDCEGLCLARSRTCSPVIPFLGCHEVIGVSGRRSTICIN